MKPVLVLRPEPGASASAKRARAHGLDPICVPLFAIEPVAWDPPEAAKFDALLLTSANAVRCAAEGLNSLRGLPVHAVGSATAQAAREAGFDIASSGDSGVDRLLASIDPELRLLHLCGEDRTAPIDAPQRITAIPVYRARPIGTAEHLRQAEADVALVHSPRAGRRFAKLVGEGGMDRGQMAIAAISDEACEAVGPGWRVAEAAEQPSDESLLALAASLCNKRGRE